MYTPVIIKYSDSSFDTIVKADGYSVSSNGWMQSSGNWSYYINGVAQKGWIFNGG